MVPVNVPLSGKTTSPVQTSVPVLRPPPKYLKLFVVAIEVPFKSKYVFVASCGLNNDTVPKEAWLFVNSQFVPFHEDAAEFKKLREVLLSVIAATVAPYPVVTAALAVRNWNRQ
jgi:hypothetical protein